MALDAVVLDPRSNEGRASKMERILRLIEGLQTLAGLICTADEPISEHDRVMLAKLLNEGASPADAARHVARARISLH
jgi:hypothetical protein